MGDRIHQYFQQALSREEQILLLREVKADPVWQERFGEIKNLYALSTLAARPGDCEKGKVSYRLFVGRRKKAAYVRLIRRVASYAAVALLLIGFTHWLTLRQIQSQDTEMLTLHVPAGQRLKLTLQDGTNVWLNARSTITYPNRFAAGERKVEIDGEAFFDVAKEEKRPFLVSSQGVEMKVLGTRFNLYSYPEANYIRTSLLEGSLMVYREKQKSHSILLHPNEESIIDNHRMTVVPIKDPSYFLWTEGIYSFREEPLINILKKLELYFDVSIEAKDPTIYTWEYSGKFRQSDGIDNILQVIRKIHKFEIEKDEENNRIILK
ncbi:MAG: FecR domain-containing protein [Tannerellaceae bacterium]|jgi:ferric-dicitrate binding protein FerR (iron transport regulator)|nr:FecR domain-containing protein [Tannerellaceae bacterium]